MVGAAGWRSCIAPAGAVSGAQLSVIPPRHMAFAGRLHGLHSNLQTLVLWLGKKLPKNFLVKKFVNGFP